MRRVVGLTLLAWLGSCSDDPVQPCPTCIPPPPAPPPLVASNPIATAPAVRTDLAFGTQTAGNVVYVSLLPGTVPDGGLATIRNARTGEEVSAAMAAGGFDPVPIGAAESDVLTVEIQVVGGGTRTLTVVVAAARRPVVVRTDPPPQKRDVPLNVIIVTVFSEPIQPSSATSIRVLRSGAPVNATVTITADGLRAVIQPDQPLTPNTGYTLSVPASVTDLDGASLEQAAMVEFETGATSALATVSTAEAALFTNPNNNSLRAFNMSAVLHNDGRVTGYFSTFYPELGMGSAGRVTCFTIVDGTAAWVGGVAEQSTTPGNIGAEFVWRVADNGQRGPVVADRLSLARFDPDHPPGDAAHYCATTPISDQLFDLVGGDILVAGATVAPQPPPPPSAGVSQIAYWIDGIFILPADGSVGWPLTTARNDRNPAWSPDGRTLAFQSDRDEPGNWDIYAINWDRSGFRRLTSGPDTDQDPAWSPDGTKIAFARSGSIYVMNVDSSGGVTRLSNPGFDADPNWSPDGTRIVFTSSRSGVNAIHVMNADGSGVLQLTSDSASLDNKPTWSPDGTKIAFARQTQQWNGAYIMNADGSGIARLTLGINSHASWSPDGSQLVFELFGMNIINVDGTGLKRFFNGFNPAWSPVGPMPAAPTSYRSVAIAAGDAQTGAPGTTLAQPLRVRVVHDDGTPQPGVTIRWNLLGSLQPNPPTFSSNLATTDSSGIASVQLTLGGAPGEVRVRAALVDGTARRGEVAFTATAVP